MLVWHHCHHVFTSCSARQSRPLPFFPHGCTFSMVTTIACCPCRSVRVTSTLTVGRVAQIATRWLPKLLRCSTTHFGFLPMADDLLFVLSCCLANVLTAQRFPSFRLDTASFGCHRVSWARGRLAFAQDVKTTPQRTRFRDVKHARIWKTV